MDIHIYTDGSCTVQTRTGGWGAIILAVEDTKILKEKRISGGAIDTTNNQMELTAILKAVKEIKRGATQPIIIFSDSELALGWIEDKFHCKTPDLRMIVSQIKTACIARKIQPEFRKVKGHSSDLYNNAADKLAKSCLNSLFVFKSGRENFVSMAEFMKEIAKKNCK